MKPWSLDAKAEVVYHRPKFAKIDFVVVVIISDNGPQSILVSFGSMSLTMVEYQKMFDANLLSITYLIGRHSLPTTGKAGRINLCKLYK